MRKFLFIKIPVIALMTGLILVFMSAFFSPFFSPSIIARADVLIEPKNDFYERNRERMEYVGRSFYTNGETGYVTLVIEPGSAREVISFENGVVLYILFKLDVSGVEWGVINLVSANDEVSGWVPMSQMYLKYDSTLFSDENAARIEERPFDLGELDFSGDMVMWT